MTDELDALCKLAARLLARPSSPDQALPAIEPDLLPLRLPDDLPDIPFPDESLLIGSMVGGELTTVAADSPLSPEETRAFYARRLTDMGWYLKDRDFPIQGGFVAVARADMIPGLFCRSPKGPSLWLNTTPLPNGRTNIRIEVNRRERHNPCVQQSSMPPQGNRRENLIPELPAPPASTLHMQGSGGGYRHQFSNAELDTALDLPGVFAHYADRLERGGWKLLRSGGDEQMRWSIWRFSGGGGRPNRGLFFALQGELPNSFILYAQGVWSEDAAE